MIESRCSNAYTTPSVIVEQIRFSDKTVRPLLSIAEGVGGQTFLNSDTRFEFRQLTQKQNFLEKAKSRNHKTLYFGICCFIMVR